MKRWLSIVLLGLIVVSSAVLSWSEFGGTSTASPQSPTGESRSNEWLEDQIEGNKLVFHVISADAPEWMRREGTGRFLCDLSDDDVEIQAVIDYAQSLVSVGGDGQYTPEVHLSHGRYRITSPIRMGMAGGQVAQSGTCSLIADGEVTIQWFGTADTDQSRFMLYVAPSSNYSDFEVSGFTLLPASNFATPKISGMYVHNVTRGTIKNIRVQYAKHFAFVANNCWFGRFENLDATDNHGMDFMFLRNNGSVVSGCRSSSNDGASIPNVRAYEFDAFTGASAWGSTLWPTEVVRSNIAGKQGLFLGWASHPYSQSIVVAHIDAIGDFANNEIISGTASGDSATLTADKVDLRSCVYTEGTAASIRDFDYEDNTYGDTYPLMLIHGPSTVVDKIRYEADNSAPMAEKWIVVQGGAAVDEDCTNVRISNLEAISQLHVNGFLIDTNVSITDVGNVIDDMTAGFVTDLAVGDTVYVWDPASGGLTPGVFTIATIPTTTSVTTTEDLDADLPTAANVFAITRSEDEYPATVISLVNASNCDISNIWAKQFSGDLVAIDSGCEGVTISNLRTWLGTGANVDWWLSTARPTALVANAGTRTTVIGPQIFDRTAGTTGMAAADEDTYGVNQTFDGPEIASANALSVSSAWGPSFRLYVTGTTAVTSMTGGHLGQIVTLIGTDGTGFELTDDNDDIQVSGGTVTLDDYEAVEMMCVDEDNQKWQDIRLQD